MKLMKRLLFMLAGAGLLAFALRAHAQELAVNGPLAIVVPNDTSTGTTQYHLVKVSGGKAVDAGAETSAILGVAGTGAGTSGNVNVTVRGVYKCHFAATATNDHYVQAAGSSGNCADAGTSLPTSGGAILGQVISGGTGAGDYLVLFGIFNQAVASGGSSGGGAVAYTASHTLAAGDDKKWVVMNCSSACAVTMAAPPSSTFGATILSVGSTTPSVLLSSATYNGGATAPSLIRYRTLEVSADAAGTNWIGIAPFKAGTNISFTPAADGVTVNFAGPIGHGSVDSSICSSDACTLPSGTTGTTPAAGDRSTSVATTAAIAGSITRPGSADTITNPSGSRVNFATSYNIPANALQVGSKILVIAEGIARETASAAGYSFDMGVGGTYVAASISTAPNTSVDLGWRIELTCMVNATGSGTTDMTCLSKQNLQTNSSAGGTTLMFYSAVLSKDSTSAITIQPALHAITTTGTFTLSYLEVHIL